MPDDDDSEATIEDPDMYKKPKEIKRSPSTDFEVESTTNTTTSTDVPTPPPPPVILPAALVIQIANFLECTCQREP
tara:strand:+ start:255 stop:482 length:228 start_codon:yes stop_codon:yes gene_type:complete